VKIQQLLKVRFNNIYFVLEARSPVFQRMFATEMKEAKDNVVEISDIGEEPMKAFLSYIYTGKLGVQDKSAETFKDLVYAADKVLYIL